MSPGGTTTLAYNGAISPGRYRLLARTTGGGELVSDPFTISVGSQVTWDIQTNIIRVSDR